MVRKHGTTVSRRIYLRPFREKFACARERQQRASGTFVPLGKFVPPGEESCTCSFITRLFKRTPEKCREREAPHADWQRACNNNDQQQFPADLPGSINSTRFSRSTSHLRAIDGEEQMSTPASTFRTLWAADRCGDHPKLQVPNRHSPAKTDIRCRTITRKRDKQRIKC